MQICLDEFERIFDTVVDLPPRDSKKNSKQAVGEEAEYRIQAAVALFHRGEYVKCLGMLQKLDTTSGNDPRVVAFRASAQSLISGKLRPGVEACVQVIRQAFYLPDIYGALGVLLLRGGEKGKAHAAFRRGLKVDPRHPALRARMREMGLRRAPVIRFLDRRHPANRVLGRVRATLLAA